MQINDIFIIYFTYDYVYVKLYFGEMISENWFQRNVRGVQADERIN